MRVESTVVPESRGTSKGLILVNFNVEQVTKEDGTVMYQYEQLRFAPPISDEAIDKAVAKRKEELKVKTITPRQLRLQLLSVGLLDDVEALCATDRAMSIWFEYSLDFQRSHPMVEEMAVQLGLTQDDVDTMFIEASKL